MPDPLNPAPPSEPTGSSRSDEVSPKAEKKKAKARKEWYNFAGRVVAQIVGAAASVGLGLFLIHRSQQANSVAPPPDVRVETPRSPGEQAIAVLPLSNFSADPGQEYFADGMTEALTAELAQIDGLHVISRTSSMRYKTDPKPIPTIGRELGVDFVVEGSVARADNRVRVTAQLIDAKSDEHLWARSYDGTMKDILDLQSRVATAIASEVKGVLIAARGATRRAVDPVAYDLYLRGRYAWNLRTPDGFANAIKHFTAATERDPEFALAYAGLADAFSLFPTASLVNRSVDNLSRARTAAEKAVALEPNLAEAHTSLGAVYFFGDRNFDGAARQFERALELNRNYPTAHQWYAIALSENGRHGEARRHAQEAVKEDPLNGVMHQALGLVHYYARDFTAAIEAQRQALELNAQLPLARVVLGKALVMAKQPGEAIAVLQQSPQQEAPEVRLMIAIAQARAGRRDAALDIIKGFDAERPPPADILVQWHAATGNHDEAFNLIRAMRDRQAPVPALLRVDPLYEPLRADQRFDAYR